jgi:hypothetical protein
MTRFVELDSERKLTMRMATLASALLLAGLMVPGTVEAEIKSGLQEGAAATPFNVKDCTGPAKNTKLCYR